MTRWTGRNDRTRNEPRHGEPSGEMERGAEQNGEPGRQAGRDWRSDELMRTAREEINCRLPAIYSCLMASSPSRFSSRPCVSSFVSFLACPPCLLACRLRSISSFHPVVRCRLVPRLVLFRLVGASRRPRCLFIHDVRPVLVRSCGHRLSPDASLYCRPRFSHHDRDWNRGDETMRRARR